MAEKEPIDVGDEIQVKKRKTAHQLRREREVAELQALLDTVGGRALIWRLLEEAGFHKLSFVGEATHTMAFNEGRRSIGNWLLSEALTARPQCYNLMRDEALDLQGKE